MCMHHRRNIGGWLTLYRFVRSVYRLVPACCIASGLGAAATYIVQDFQCAFARYVFTRSSVSSST